MSNPFCVLTPAQIHHSVNCKVKRFLDIIGAVIGLLVTAILLVPIAIAIKLDDPGPIFFGQVRCGVNGKPFKMWKFRSMVVDAHLLQHQISNQAKGHVFKNRNDPRVTQVGRFLRRTSLDELPQFWNVLRGEMSLVGTRPPTIEEVAQYRTHHWERLKTKPGITGEWQVNGRSGIDNFEDIVRLDVAYQQKWSIIYDLQLISRTVLVVFSRSGAY